MSGDRHGADKRKSVMGIDDNVGDVVITQNWFKDGECNVFYGIVMDMTDIKVYGAFINRILRTV